MQMQGGENFININKILASFDALYCEINEYNATYWSKFLFNMWTTMGTTSVTAFNFVLHTESVYLKFLFAYFVLIFTTIFLFTILTSASGNKQANKSYKIMNSLIISLLNIKIQSKKRFKVSDNL